MSEVKIVKCVNCNSEDLGRRGFADEAKTRPILVCKSCGKRKTYNADEVLGSKFGPEVEAAPIASAKVKATPPVAPKMAAVTTPAPIAEEVPVPATNSTSIKFRFGHNGIVNEIVCNDWETRADEIEREMNCKVSFDEESGVWEFIPEVSTKG